MYLYRDYIEAKQAGLEDLATEIYTALQTKRRANSILLCLSCGRNPQQSLGYLCQQCATDQQERAQQMELTRKRHQLASMDKRLTNARIELTHKSHELQDKQRQEIGRAHV